MKQKNLLGLRPLLSTCLYLTCHFHYMYSLQILHITLHGLTKSHCHWLGLAWITAICLKVDHCFCSIRHDHVYNGISACRQLRSRECAQAFENKSPFASTICDAGGIEHLCLQKSLFLSRSFLSHIHTWKLLPNFVDFHLFEVSWMATQQVSAYPHICTHTTPTYLWYSCVRR